MTRRLSTHATYDDVLALPENLVGELVFGMLHTHPRPRPIELRAASRVASRLGATFDHDGPGGWVMLREPELHLGPHVVVPNLAGWRRERLPAIPLEGHLTTPPDWCCEVLSKSTEKLDRGEKKRIYETFMVSHYWLVDVEEKTIEVHVLRGSELRVAPEARASVQTVRGDEGHRLPPFQTYDLPLRDLWAR